MKSLATGGVNDLSSVRHEFAGKILANAMHQVSRTQASIDAAVGKKVADTPVIEGHGDATGWLKLAAREMLGDPGMSVEAVANSEPRDVLGLIA
jgi:hypothetical protein